MPPPGARRRRGLGQLRSLCRGPRGYICCHGFDIEALNRCLSLGDELTVITFDNWLGIARPVHNTALHRRFVETAEQTLDMWYGKIQDLLIGHLVQFSFGVQILGKVYDMSAGARLGPLKVGVFYNAHKWKFRIIDIEPIDIRETF